MKKIKKILPSRKLLLMIVLITIASVSIATFAKYVIEEYHGYYLNAKHFYFTSNRLKKNQPTYLINNWGGVGSFNISFNVLSEKNQYVYSDFDIPYTVTATCPNDVTCTLDKSSSIVYRNSANHSDTVTLSVSPQRNYSQGETLSITISATSTSPYIETISAVFQYVVGQQGVSYEIEDAANQVYLILKITNAITYCRVNTAFSTYSVGDFIDNAVYRTLDPQDQAKCIGKKVDLSFNPSVVLLDTTEKIIDSSTYTSTTINGTDYVNTLNTSIAPLSTMAIKFYKVNHAQNYTYPIVNQTSVIGVNFHD